MQEWGKYALAPVQGELYREYQYSRAWGFVEAARSLIEQALKVILRVRKLDVETGSKGHELYPMFKMLRESEIGESDVVVLSEYYVDFRNSFTNGTSFPFDCVGGFLLNLDGLDGSGFSEWRYFMIEKREKIEKLPVVDVHFMHEMAFGCLQLIKAVLWENPILRQNTYSFRLSQTCWNDYNKMLMKRMNSQGPWSKYDDWFEIFYGPDYRQRYGYVRYVECGEKRVDPPVLLGEWPNVKDVLVVDRRQDAAGEKWQRPERVHLMYRLTEYAGLTLIQ